MEEKRTTGLARLAEPARDALRPFAARAAWPAGFVVYERGAPADGVFIVMSGCVVLRSRVRAGRGFVPWIAAPGETFGAEGLSAHARYATDARADVATETLFLSFQRFRSLVREQPQHALTLMSQVLAERSVLLDKLRELTTLNVEQRLITALIRLAHAEGFADEGGNLVLPPQRYRLLYELVGATRESVTLVLGRLSAAGVVHRSGTTLTIAKLSDLTARLETDPFDEDLSFAPVPASPGSIEQTVQ